MYALYKVNRILERFLPRLFINSDGWYCTAHVSDRVPLNN